MHQDAGKRAGTDLELVGLFLQRGPVGLIKTKGECSQYGSKDSLLRCKMRRYASYWLAEGRTGLGPDGTS